MTDDPGSTDERPAERRLRVLQREITTLKRQMASMTRQQEELASLVVSIGKRVVRTPAQQMALTSVKQGDFSQPH
jgi:hypothetical protein